MSHWVTVFKKRNVCHTELLCLRKNGKKCSKAVKSGQKLSVFDRFWQFLTVFFLNTVTKCDKYFFLKHSDSVWQTFFFLNTVTLCDKHVFKHSDLFLSGKFILRKNQKIWLPFKNKFEHRRKIGLEYLTNRRTNTRTVRRTFGLIESIGPEGRCFKKKCMTHDTWHVIHGWLLKFSQTFSSPALTVSWRFWTKGPLNELLNQSINDKGVYSLNC